MQESWRSGSSGPAATREPGRGSPGRWPVDQAEDDPLRLPTDRDTDGYREIAGVLVIGGLQPPAPCLDHQEVGHP